MEYQITDRGFEVVAEKNYPKGETERLVQQSSAIGDYEDSFNFAGSSFLWIGSNHHLNREQVGEFKNRLEAWLKTGSLKLVKDKIHGQEKTATQD